ncbi:protein phosphatase 5 [Rozella allomycis CSF55]|uniref:protein-serine/threonine phosphatase n=1 Tax=Rozella allomycis (strain CSF55) TaxID=988480 RepID=A0A4P9YEV5_ROZAC|nr:protein phosphatase 5 [Rozella allomycis CSF55]
MAVQCDHKYVKAYYRRALANVGLQKFKESLKDFKIVCQVAPGDLEAKKRCETIEKIVKKMEFEKAIAVDEHHKIIWDLINENDIDVSPSYDGKILEDEITVDFVLDMMERFKNQKLIPFKFAAQILRRAREYFLNCPNMVNVVIPENSKLSVCGDTHGQFYDVLKLFEINGNPSPQNIYLFNGDFVDRGSFSFEVILTFLSWKLACPESIYLSRGNHETDSMNFNFGFKHEVEAKFNLNLFKMFSSVFEAMPIANLIQDKIFVVHGGIGDGNFCLEDINKVDRFKQPTDKDPLMTALLWSDPQPEPGVGFGKRGASYSFGPDVTHDFLKRNNLDFIIRSHEVKEEGYEIAHGGKCITIFSAPNYCDTIGNKGAYINFDSDLKMEINQFTCAPHPNIKAMAYAPLNNFM